MDGNVFDQYVSLFGGGINFAWIIAIILVFSVSMIGVSIIKYKLNASVIKKNVKIAIRELMDEEEINITKQQIKREEENKDTTVK